MFNVSFLSFEQVQGEIEEGENKIYDLGYEHGEVRKSLRLMVLKCL